MTTEIVVHDQQQKPSESKIEHGPKDSKSSTSKKKKVGLSEYNNSKPAVSIKDAIASNLVKNDALKKYLSPEFVPFKFE